MVSLALRHCVRAKTKTVSCYICICMPVALCEITHPQRFSEGHTAGLIHFKSEKNHANTHGLSLEESLTPSNVHCPHVVRPSFKGVSWHVITTGAQSQFRNLPRHVRYNPHPARVGVPHTPAAPPPPLPYLPAAARL